MLCLCCCLSLSLSSSPAPLKQGVAGISVRQLHWISLIFTQLIYSPCLVPAPKNGWIPWIRHDPPSEMPWVKLLPCQIETFSRNRVWDGMVYAKHVPKISKIKMMFKNLWLWGILNIPLFFCKTTSQSLWVVTSLLLCQLPEAWPRCGYVRRTNFRRPSALVTSRAKPGKLPEWANQGRPNGWSWLSYC
jgi:hypothetical protein